MGLVQELGLLSFVKGVIWMPLFTFFGEWNRKLNERYDMQFSRVSG